MLRELTRPARRLLLRRGCRQPAARRGRRPGAHKSEGAFYIWSDSEIGALLGADADDRAARFGIEPDGNAPQDPQGEFTGQNLLYIAAVDRRGRGADRPAPRRR